MNFAGDAPNGFMEDNKFRTIGILGGMGPEATLSLFAQIIKATPAKKDQDHLPKQQGYLSRHCLFLILISLVKIFPKSKHNKEFNRKVRWRQHAQLYVPAPPCY